MSTYYLQFTLKSDASFGRGDGVAGEVDAEVMHDEWGLPYLGGRAIKGILVNECADILAALPEGDRKEPWLAATAARLFGRSGSGIGNQALLSIGDALLPEDFRAIIQKNTQKVIEDRWAQVEKARGLKAQEEQEEQENQKKKEEQPAAEEKKEKEKPETKGQFIQRQRALLSKETLETLTTIRYQTAMEISGVPKEHSLRTQRVILRETPFEARLEFSDQVADHDLALLLACVKAFRRAGTARNRGRGQLEAKLLDAERKPVVDGPYLDFKKEYLEAAKNESA